MSNKPEVKEKEPVEQVEVEPEESNLVAQPREVSEDEFDDLMPQMNVSVPAEQPQSQLISDELYMGVLQEIMETIREDRKQVSDYVDNFADMVINDGDATTSSKEALVNLVKIKTDMADKMAKVADLMTRLKQKNTYAYSGPHMNAVQQNNINIGTDAADFNRRELIRAINQAKKKKD
jgi:hypothetical protein